MFVKAILINLTGMQACVLQLIFRKGVSRQPADNITATVTNTKKLSELMWNGSALDVSVYSKQ